MTAIRGVLGSGLLLSALSAQQVHGIGLGYVEAAFDDPACTLAVGPGVVVETLAAQVGRVAALANRCRLRALENRELNDSPVYQALVLELCAVPVAQRRGHMQMLDANAHCQVWPRGRIARYGLEIHGMVITDAAGEKKWMESGHTQKRDGIIAAIDGLLGKE